MKIPENLPIITVSCMPGKDFIPTRETDLKAMAANLARKLPEAAPDLGITPSQVLALQEAVAAYSSALAAVVAQRSALAATIAHKRTVAEDLVEQMRAINRRARVSPAATRSLLSQLGLPPGDETRTRILAETPTGLIALPNGNNGALLRWSRGKNAVTNIFVVEAQAPGEAGWTQIAVTQRTRCHHREAIPGHAVRYRVMARSASHSSNWSEVAYAYVEAA